MEWDTGKVKVRNARLQFCCIFNERNCQKFLLSKVFRGGMGDARVRSGVKAAPLRNKTIAWTVHGNELESQSKNNLKWIYPFIPHYCIPPWLHLGGTRLGERLLKSPTSLLSQHSLRNAFLLLPLAPCVDALSAGCVLHVKQAADAVREKATRRDKEGDEDTRRPRCHATRLASPRFAATPFVAPCPATPLITSPPWCPPNSQSPFPPPLPSIRPSLCHPPRTRCCVSPGKHALVGV